MRIGHGYDAHQLAVGRKLILGGVEIEHDKGLLGHSDADVLLHSICDAILGALGLGDIGQHFPDTDARYAGADSRMLLKHVSGLMHGKGFQITNVDATLIAQAPKLQPYISAMQANIANDLECKTKRVNIKATTTERMGFVGREEGYASHAVVLLKKM